MTSVPSGGSAAPSTATAGPPASATRAVWPSRRSDAGEEVGIADEAGDERRGRAVVEHGRRVDLLDAAPAQDGDAIGQGERLLLVVGDEDDGRAEGAVELLQLDLQVDAQLAVERAERLVHQEDARPEDDRPRHGDALLLAAGELARMALLVSLQPDGAQRLPHPRPDLGRRHAPGPQGIGDVLLHAEMGEQRVVLEDDAEAALIGGHAVGEAPVDQDRRRRSACRSRRSATGSRICPSPRARAA